MSILESPAAKLLKQLTELGATHAVGLPDNGSAALFDLLGQRSDPQLVRVTREGEAFAIASGLWIGGASPVVVIQNTGLLEAGDGLRGTAVRMGVPLVCVIGYRGYPRMTRTVDGPQPPFDAPTLQRADLDSVALLTEPTLRAWGIPYRVCAPDQIADKLVPAWERAHHENRPVALLLTGSLGN